MNKPDVPQTAVVLADFPGLVLDRDPHDIPPGASDDQVNATCENSGQLTSRAGFVLVTFEE